MPHEKERTDRHHRNARIEQGLVLGMPAGESERFVAGTQGQGGLQGSALTQFPNGATERSSLPQGHEHRQHDCRNNHHRCRKRKVPLHRGWERKGQIDVINDQGPADQREQTGHQHHHNDVVLLAFRE